MDRLRAEARAFLQQADQDSITNFSAPAAIKSGALDELWRDISSKDSAGDLEICEDLLVAESVLQAWGDHALSNNDTEAANALYSWLVEISLPSSEFAEALEASYSASREKTPLTEDLKKRRSRFSLSVSCLRVLNDILPILKAENAVDIITALATFTSEVDPWTTGSSREDASSTIGSCIAHSDPSSFWLLLGDILKSKIRPIFAKTKNPAVTPAGRKNFHPVRLSRFDSSLMDPETKPWKFRDVYATTVVDWVLSQFLPSDCTHLEEYFPLLVPPILSLIDDDSLSFKARGCNLLAKFLAPIRACRSDLLRRTNLSSVFDDALTPCLLSIPTITPEDESLQLLGTAYPALLSVLQIRYHRYHPTSDIPPSGTKASPSSPEDKTTYITRITSILRNNIIPSFHHVSSTTPTATSTSLLASFPFPRLSTFLLQQIDIFAFELGIHTTKYLQEIIPLIYTTLSNPFGTAYPPLLLAGVATARAVILNAHPRIWRFRGELLGAFCECWVHVCDEEEEEEEEEEEKNQKQGPVAAAGAEKTQLVKLKKQLQGAVYLLKMAVMAQQSSTTTTTTISEGEQNTAPAAAAAAEEEEEKENVARVEDDDDDNDDDDDENINIQKECETLAKADETLRELLFVEISDDDNDDAEYF